MFLGEARYVIETPDLKKLRRNRPLCEGSRIWSGVQGTKIERD